MHKKNKFMDLIVNNILFEQNLTCTFCFVFFFFFFGRKKWLGGGRATSVAFLPVHNYWEI